MGNDTKYNIKKPVPAKFAHFERVTQRKAIQTLRKDESAHYGTDYDPNPNKSKNSTD